MAADTRLQSWAVAISGEGRLTGFPRNIHTREHLARSPLHDYSNVQIVHLPKQIYHKIFAQWMLIFDTCRVVTMVIFGGSVLHHALNAQQFIYSYAPHKPTSLSRCCQELPWRYRFLAWLLTFFYTLIQPHFQVDATSRQRHLLAMDQGCLAQSQATGDSVLHGAHYHH